MFFEFIRTSKDAIVPSKAHPSDSGFDLSIIKEVKRIGKVVMYDTGIQVCPPKGYYFDCIPRSSIIKTGYILANSIGVIDEEYRGNILVPLVKINEEEPDISLPCRIAQLVLRKRYNIEAIEVTEFKGISERGSNGFGSSG